MNTPRAEEQLRLAVDAIGLSRAELDRAIQYLAPVRGCDSDYERVCNLYGQFAGLLEGLRLARRGGDLSLDSGPAVKP